MFCVYQDEGILMGADADEHAALQYLCSGVRGILAHMQLRNWVW
jgi:hypothetical protein